MISCWFHGWKTFSLCWRVLLPWHYLADLMKYTLMLNLIVIETSICLVKRSINKQWKDICTSIILNGNPCAYHHWKNPLDLASCRLVRTQTQLWLVSYVNMIKAGLVHAGVFVCIPKAQMGFSLTSEKYLLSINILLSMSQVHYKCKSISVILICSRF